MRRYLGNPIVNAAQTRQGRMGREIFWVLVFSTALAALALFAVWAWHADDLAATERKSATYADESTPFDLGEPAAQQKPPTPGR